MFERAGLADDFEVIHRFAGIGSDGSDGFGRVDGAAAAEADDVVAVAGELGAFANEGDGGFAGDAEVLGLEGGKVLFGAGLVSAGDDEGGGAEGGSQGGEFGDGAGAEDDAGGGGEFEAVQNAES